jgi:hypothetical protein
MSRNRRRHARCARRGQPAAKSREIETRLDSLGIAAWAGGEILDREGRSARTAKFPNPIRGQFRRRSVPTIPKDDLSGHLNLSES